MTRIFPLGEQIHLLSDQHIESNLVIHLSFAVISVAAALHLSRNLPDFESQILHWNCNKSSQYLNLQGRRYPCNGGSWCRRRRQPALRTRNPALAGGGKGTVYGAPGEQWSVSGREGGATRQWCRLPSRRITHILRFGNGLDLSGLYSKWTKSKMGFDPALSDEL